MKENLRSIIRLIHYAHCPVLEKIRKKGRWIA
jgi:hypothetical protein